MKLTEKRIEEIKINGYQLEFENVFNHAFENYKKIAFYAGLALFVFSVVIGIAAIAIISFYFGIAFLNEKLAENLKIENLSGIYLALYFFVVVFLSAFLSPFNAGFLKMADCAEKDNEFHVSTFFEYYKTPYFKELFISTAVITIISSGLSMLFELVNIDIVGFLVSISISFLTVLTVPLIIFEDLKAMNAIQSSFSIVLKQPFVLILLLFVAFIGSLVGFIGCCIGIFFTIPFMYSMHYAIYCAIIGIDSIDEYEEIGPDPE